VPAKDASFYGPVQLPSIGLAHSFADEPYATPFQLNPFDGEGLANATFREYQDNGLPAVVAEWGNTTLTWIFDHEQGGMPVQAMLHRGDSLASYSRSTYQNVGGRWFPKATGFFDGSNQLLKRVEIQRVTFDRPEHLQEITPVEFGALSGTQFGGPSGLLWWNGVELVPDDEFLPLLWLDPTIMDDRIAQFMVEDTDRTVEQYRAALRQSGDALRERYKREYGEELKLKKTAEKDPWDVYVDEFVSKHKFPEAPTKKAFEIRDSAKKLRDTQRLRDAADMRKAKREGDKRKLEEFEKREKKIYDRLLVRPLDRLAAAVAKSSETQTTP
jgi:hypothetical protein